MLRGATVVFDLDGTLVDTLPDIARAANAVLTAAGGAPLPPEELRRFVGEGSRVLLSRSFAAQGRMLDPASLEQAYVAFIAHHLKHLADASMLYPGLIEALDALASAGALLAVCTNKPSVLATGVLKALGIWHRFAFIAGGDTFPKRKPDPTPLLETIERAGGDPGRAVLVGDSAIDIETGRRAGVPVVAVDFGYSEAPIASLGPDAVISAYPSLEGTIRTLLAAAPAEHVE